ncbi:MAG: SBBP repeat-containing protein [Myxococcota bacterium]|nr:SBBP repeat-containing protein [Myxococcota bacterium]
MRLASSFVLGVSLLASCNNKKDKPAEKVVAPPPPQEKKPVDTKPLPPLTADPGGATGKATWATGFGGLGIDSPRGIAVSPAGEAYVVGYFDGEIDLGPGGKHKAPAKEGEKKVPSDAYLVKVGADGTILWGKTWGDLRDDTANGVAVKGDIVVAVGSYLDNIKIGEFAHKAAGSDDVYVAAFKTDGTPQWLFTAGSIDSDGANAIVAAPDGGWIVGGSFSDVATFDKHNIKSKGGTDAMLLKLKATGDLEWVKQFGGKHNDSIRHLAVDAQGNIYVQGTFRDTSEWGGKPMAAGGATTDIVLAKYDLNGDHVWSERFGNAFEEGASGLAVDPAGNITMAGSFDRNISFGEGDDHTAVGESDIFVASYTNAGKLKWARAWGADRNDAASAVVADAAGNTTAIGWFEGKVNFGKGDLVSKGNKDVFAVKLDEKGAVVWAQSFGDKDHDQGRAAAIDDKGNVYAAGLYRFALDVGPKALESVRAEGDRIPKPDTFVLKLER